MAISLEDFERIKAQMPKGGKGDEIELSEADEAALDRVWEKVAKEKTKKTERAFA